MTIYIDNDYKCHLYGTGMRAIETDVFDGKCKEYIEGMRYVPDGETWVRDDGEVFTGAMIAPWVDSAALALAQAAADSTQEKADEQSMILLDMIVQLISEEQ